MEDVDVISWMTTWACPTIRLGLVELLEVKGDLPGNIDLLGSGVVIELSVCEGSYPSAGSIAKRTDLPITMPWTANCIVKV